MGGGGDGVAEEAARVSFGLYIYLRVNIELLVFRHSVQYRRHLGTRTLAPTYVQLLVQNYRMSDHYECALP